MQQGVTLAKPLVVRVEVASVSKIAYGINPDYCRVEQRGVFCEQRRKKYGFYEDLRVFCAQRRKKYGFLRGFTRYSVHSEEKNPGF